MPPEHAVPLVRLGLGEPPARPELEARSDQLVRPDLAAQRERPERLARLALEDQPVPREHAVPPVPPERLGLGVQLVRLVHVVRPDRLVPPDRVAQLAQLVLGARQEQPVRPGRVEQPVRPGLADRPEQQVHEVQLAQPEPGVRQERLVHEVPLARPEL